jgi:uncharacterized protein (DUF2141 family)
MPYLFALFLLFALPPTVQQVNVEVSAPLSGGEIFVAAYADQEGFDNDDFVANARQVLGGRGQLAELNLPIPQTGDYVFAAFQDLNGNGKLDCNFLGVPTEPYGFGKLPPSKWRAPSFGEVATRIEGSDHLQIELRRWSEY